jgi:type II secretory pathway pseudopilin PulG
LRVAKQNQGGFSLLEVTFAAVVLAVTAVGLAAGMAQGDHLTRGVKEEVAARNAIRSVLAEIGAASWADAAKDHHGQGFEVNGLIAPEGDADGKPGLVTFEYGPGGDTSLYRVTVVVSWRIGSGSRTIEAIRYLSNVRGDTGTPVPLAQLGN